ncbi:MAG TPA: hypothetical protein VFI55_06925 [Mycobacterium sp.]|nr:hypothetical protein [Mycobacterium sp.]
MTEDALSWLAALPRAVQTALLANPSGDVPPDIITRMPSLVVKTYWTSNPDAGRWELHRQYATAATDGRARLDRWWKSLPLATRDALVEHRDGLVPNEHRAYVADLGALGVAVYVGASSAGEFSLHPLVSAYLDLHAESA